MSWNYIRFGDLFDYENKSKIKAGYGLPEGEFPFYTSSVELCKYFNTYLFKKRSLIFGTGGNASIHYCDVPFSVSTDCLVSFVKDQNIVDPKFVYYYISGNINLLEEGFKGAGLKHISKGYINEIQIPLPPLPIQKRIAEILDAADALKRKDQELIKKYDVLAQAIFIDMFGDPVKNEKGWETKILKNITTKIGSGATPSGGKTAYKTSGISLIRSMNVYDFSFKWKDLAFIDDTQAAKLNNVEVKSKDVLFNITGASVCRCSIVPDELLPARVNQHVSIIRAKTELLNPVFLNHLLVSDKVKRNLLGVGAGGGAVMEAITKEQLENFEIILPPINVQNKFEELINIVFAQKKIQISSESFANKLFGSLVQKAFNSNIII